jgi:hypothetical protein
MSKELKYNIDVLLKKFPYEDHAKLIKLIPVLLNIKESTFFKWKATQLSDNFEIPEGKFQMLCVIFDVSPDEMRLYKISNIDIKSILKAS